MPDKTTESMVEAYLSGILSRTGASHGLSFRQWVWTKEQPNEYGFETVGH